MASVCSRLLVSALVAVSCFAGGTYAMADVVWQHSYEGDVLPEDADPVWTRGRSVYDASQPYASTDGDVLTLTSGDTAADVWDSGYYLLGSPAWDGSTATGSTVEIRVRHTQGATTRFQVGLGDRTYDLLMSATRLAAGEAAADYSADGGAGVDIDMTQFHVVRLVAGPGSVGVDVYVDGSVEKAFALTVSGGATNRLLLNDGGTSGFAGTNEYDYIRWTNAAAVVPVPEPATLLLLGAAGAMILGRRRGGV